MPTDLTPMRRRSLEGGIRITDLQRLQAGDWANVQAIRSPVPALVGQSILLVVAIRDRFPIEDLQLRATCDKASRVMLAPLGMVHFPEQSTHLPDPILETSTCRVPANTTQSYLLKVTLPANAPPGICAVQVNACSQSHGRAVATVHLDISSYRARTEPHDQLTAARICFWPHWSAFCRYYHLELWSEAFWQRAADYLREMAAGGTDIVMASVIEDPFRYPLPPELYHLNHFPGMIDWIRERDGRFRFNYDRYDRYVELNFSVGIDREIECHAMLPCKMQRPWLTYFDEAEGRQVEIETDHDALDYREAWSQFLRSFVEHNRRRGWLEKLTLCIYDEPQDEHSFRSAARLVREHAPQVRITAAITPEQAFKLTDILDIATLNAGEFSTEAAASLRSKGIDVRWYNCCTPAWANTLLVSPLSDAYRLPWITAAQKLGGYLRWSIFDWTDDPWHDPAFNWPTGDTYLLYPGKSGPASSLRWETYKVGLADLKLFLAARKSADNHRRCRFDAHLNTIGTMNPQGPTGTIASWRQSLCVLLNPS